MAGAFSNLWVPAGNGQSAADQELMTGIGYTGTTSTFGFQTEIFFDILYDNSACT